MFMCAAEEERRASPPGEPGIPRTSCALHSQCGRTHSGTRISSREGNQHL